MSACSLPDNTAYERGIPLSLPVLIGIIMFCIDGLSPRIDNDSTAFDARTMRFRSIAFTLSSNGAEVTRGAKRCS
jgi:hypothetical protein